MEVRFQRSDAGLSESKYADTPDACVAVAIAHVTALPFEQCYELLFDGDWHDPDWRVDRWLVGREIGGYRFLRRDYTGDDGWFDKPLRIENFCAEHRLGSYLVSATHPESAHMFAVVNGVIHDTALSPYPIMAAWRSYRSNK